MENKQPTYGNGKICYLEIPAADVDISASFYKDVFGWHIRKRGDGHIAFDDGVGEVSGTWVLGRKPLSEPGIIISIMVDDAKATLDAIVAHGGIITQELGKDAPEITAHFSDPAGNILGIYQEPG
ncbi:VOC family protein [Ginsengibacter hankyongi]|uniref:VOC family protein n=1 Tax=Ginsengibacter hankyongi TaxID=2607284 RepID=A0A5J5IC56_9BACT|nr:VOC family protein [Ginsengibacter hankyongi]KAA9034542.1 VOC family protein [Ginsengibacter hankyongi]